MEIPLLSAVITIFSISILVLFICHKLRIPAIVGYLITGLLAGPHGLELVQEIHEVEILAEIGIVLLLFTIGIEFSFERLAQIKRSVLLGGSLQVVLTSLTVFVLAQIFNQPFGKAVFLGFLISLSSTAIVLRLIQERAEMDSSHGKNALGILIYQDIIIVPMILLTPLLSAEGGTAAASPATLLIKGVAIILFVIVGAKWIVPNLLFQIARTRNRELFILSIVVICFAVAWLTSSAGLSLALGAFLAGLIISESEYSHQALGSILPFKDVFASFFFVSIGMLLNIGFLLQNLGLVLLAAVGVIILKALMAGLAIALIGFPIRSAVLVGLSLSQVGEFSFILSETGIQYGLLSGENYQMFLSISILTMAFTPFMIAVAPSVAKFFAKIPFFNNFNLEKQVQEDENITLKDHLIIIGYGLNGRNVARAAFAAEIPYLIIELNAETVKEEQEKGEPIYFADATHDAVLKHMKVEDAKVVVIAISDPTATRQIIEVTRRLNPNVYIIVRTRYIQELEPLFALGASAVIPEEFETSVEIFTRVLNKYLIPKNEINDFIAEVRADNYDIFRSIKRKTNTRTNTLADIKLHVPEIEIWSVRVEENSPASEKTLGDIALRKQHGITAFAIRRNNEVLANPHGDARLQPNDVIVLVGRRQKLTEVLDVFKASCDEAKFLQ